MVEQPRKKIDGKAVLGDTEKTLNAIRQLPPAVRRKCARAVGSEVFPLVEEIEKTTAPSAELDKFIEHHVMRAKELRYAAIKGGAKDYSDPRWATSVLYASWVLAVSGQLDAQRSKQIIKSIEDWLSQEGERWKSAR